MSRAQQILGGALLLQILLILLFQSPFTRAGGSSEPRPLLPELETMVPARLEVSDDEGNEIVLFREGQSWAIGEAGGYPADTSKVNRVVDLFRVIEVRRPIVKNSRYFAGLRVADDEFEKRLRIWGEGEKDPAIDVYVGSSPNVGLTNVRVKGKDEVYEVGGLPSYEVRTEKSSWIQGRFVDIPSAQITGFSLSNKNGSFELVQEDGSWRITAPEKLISRTVSDEKVMTFLSTCASIYVSEPAGRADPGTQGFERPSASIEFAIISFEDGASVETSETVTVGSGVPDSEGFRFITKSSTDFAATVYETSVTQMMEKRISDLYP